jgi:hypothetical protein
VNVGLDDAGEYFGQQVSNFSIKEDDSRSVHAKGIILHFHAQILQTCWHVS